MNLYNFGILIATPILKPKKKTTDKDKLGKKADKWKNQAELSEAWYHNFKEFQNINFMKPGKGQWKNLMEYWSLRKKNLVDV